MALDAWVTSGTAPDSIIAYRVNAQGQITMSRPLCPYPQQATYSGHGSIYLAQNFSCAVPPAGKEKSAAR